MPTPTPPPPAASRLLLVRHGATAPNLAGLRCGGDLDVALVEAGVAQAHAAARRLAAFDPAPGVIVCGALQRTRQTAAIIAGAFEKLEIVVDAGFDERRLGAWNLQPIALTEPWLRAQRTPPGGESEPDFLRRVRLALARLRSLRARRPLLVTSKGVARAICIALGCPRAAAMGNGEIAQFDLGDLGDPSDLGDLDDLGAHPKTSCQSPLA